MTRKLRTWLTAYAFLFPALLIMAVFTFYPVIYGSYLGFTHYTAANFAKGEAPRWIGLTNFIKVFNDPIFQIALLNSLKYLLVVPALQLAALATAVLTNRKLPGMTFFRASYYVPVVTSIALAGVMWNWIYQKDGTLNWALKFLHFLTEKTSFGWLNNEHTALWAIMLVTFWRGFGYYMVLYLAGLQAIPKELEEAAELDGANRWQTFWRIIVPLMRPTILLCTLLSSIAAIRVLQEVQVLTNGGPLNSTYTALLYVYSKAFQGFSFDYGEAQAAGLIIAVVGFILSYLNFRFIRVGSGVR
jgi:putative chitobiose transport system permease protein